MSKSMVFTEEEKEFIIHNYVTLHRGVNAIGRDMGGIAGVTIQSHLKKWGVKIRNMADAMQLCRAYNVNDNYFKIQSHNMAYILGFLAADGVVSKDTNHIIIDLKRADEDILYKIKEELQFEGPIQQYVNNSGCEYSRLRICSAIMKQDLAHYGIVPQKTFNLTPPTFLESQYYISYIRGYFDGDGCVYFNYEKPSYNWYICGARKEVMNWIRCVLVNQYCIDSEVTTSTKTLKNGDPFYYVQIYNSDTILRLFELLYLPNSLYLERKYKEMKRFYDIRSKRPYSLSDKEKRYADLT